MFNPPVVKKAYFTSWQNAAEIGEILAGIIRKRPGLVARLDAQTLPTASIFAKSRERWAIRIDFCLEIIQFTHPDGLVWEVLHPFISGNFPTTIRS